MLAALFLGWIFRVIQFYITHCFLAELIVCVAIQLSMLFVVDIDLLWVEFTYYLEQNNNEVSSLLDLCICVVLVALHHTLSKSN
jgi:hypothetical protein